MDTIPSSITAGDVIKSATTNAILNILKAIVPVATPISASGDLDDTAMFLIVDATAGEVDLNLPLATDSGKWYLVAKGDSSGNSVKVLPQAGDNISGGDNWTMSAQYNLVLLVADGVHTWLRITSV